MKASSRPAPCGGADRAAEGRPCEQPDQAEQRAIPSGDHHIPTGAPLFGAEAILRDGDMRVARNAPTGTLSAMFQAGALIELSGDVGTAFDLYCDTCDIHELPTMDQQTQRITGVTDDRTRMGQAAAHQDDRPRG